MKKNLFSKICVVYCLTMCTIITAVVLFRAEITAGIVTALVGVWGGELLLLLLKRILGDNSDTKAKIKTNDEEAPI